MLKPLAADKWNFTTAAHLLNRAGFGGPPAEIERLVKLGPDKAVSWFVDYEKIPDDTAVGARKRPGTASLMLSACFVMIRALRPRPKGSFQRLHVLIASR